MKSTSRRRFLFLPLLSAAPAAYARLVEPEWLEFTERSCPIPGLAQPIHLTHLSDLHASSVVSQSLIEHAIQMALDSKPDLICITGDFVTNARGFDARWYVKALRRLSEAAPVFATLGNHDGGAWAAATGGFKTTLEITRIVEESGVMVLANRSAIYDAGSSKLQLVGLGDLWAEDLDANLAFRDVSPLPTVLLSHNPDSKILVGSYPWRLMLSGHTHGGQVVMPIAGLSPAPVWDHRYIAGMKAWRDRWIHVSRGVGNVHGVRFNCRPEVTRITLIPASRS
jgi:predicted MPP superfamily phosphohydrolase